MAGQGADERPLAALGPQVRVDGEERAFRGGALAGPDQAGGEPGRRLERASSVGSPLAAVVAAVRLGDEDHVDVAGVVELAGAALAHRHDREPDRRRRPAGARRGRSRGRPRGPRRRGRRVPRRPRPRWRRRSGRGRPGAGAGGGRRRRAARRRARRRAGAAGRRGAPAAGGLACHGLRVVGVGGHGAEELRADRLRVRDGGPRPGRAARRLSSGWRARWSARALLTPRTAVSRARNAGSAAASRSGSGPARRPAPGRPGRGPGRRPGRARRAADGRSPVMPRAASSRSALGTSAKPILASQPDREVRAPLTVMSVYRPADLPGNTAVTCGVHDVAAAGRALDVRHRAARSPPVPPRVIGMSHGGSHPAQRAFRQPRADQPADLAGRRRRWPGSRRATAC